MEIRDPIHGSIELSDGEVKVLDNVAYQRLRAIKQLGFSEFSFPGATHNRYLHSIGVCHLSGLAFDAIFKDFPFEKPESKSRYRQTVRLAALLHDIGHGPLSHTSEEVMPSLSQVDVKAYKYRDEKRWGKLDPQRQANHEDYTIRFITDSPLTESIKSCFSDIDPLHIACLVDRTLECPDDFFISNGLNLRNILSQIVSSEMDVDRMDYLERDAYFCGTNYGKVELNWLLANLTYHELNGELCLALNRRALYTFDDFLLARHHMHLMVYFHHKSIIYEEMLMRYLSSEECTFFLPGQIDEYIQFTDYSLYEHLASVENRWAKRIAQRNPFRMLFELHSLQETPRPLNMQKELEDSGIESVLASSTARLSKYHTASDAERSHPIFVVDQYDSQSEPYPIDQSTEIFQKYEEIRRIERIYVAPEHIDQAKQLIQQKKL